MNVVVRASGFGARLRPRTAPLSVLLGSADRTTPHDVPLRAQVSIARACDRVAGGRKEPA
jgi:hypothetical protein